MGKVLDVVISGAGPAGARAAGLCAQRGLRTLLVERDGIPRDKCCAGGLLERAQALLGEPLPDSVIEQEITQVSIVHRDFREDFALPQRAAVTVRRRTFDAYLVEKAQKTGAEVWSGSPVERVKETDDGVVLVIGGREVRARTLIIAEGATSHTTSSLFGPYTGRRQGMGVATVGRLAKDPGGRMEFHLLGTPIERFPYAFKFPLNGWMFAAKNGANIGVAGKDVTGERYRAALGDLQRAIEDRYGELLDPWTAAHPIPVVPRKRLHTRRCLLVGDAAGLASPMSGEGMTNALKSAAYASDAVAGLIHDGVPLARYRRNVAADILPVIRASRAISPPVQWLMGVVDTAALMRELHGDPDLVATCLRISRGEEGWDRLLGLVVRRFPRYFFSSLT